MKKESVWLDLHHYRSTYYNQSCQGFPELGTERMVKDSLQAFASNRRFQCYLSWEPILREQIARRHGKAKLETYAPTQGPSDWRSIEGICCCKALVKAWRSYYLEPFFDLCERQLILWACAKYVALDIPEDTQPLPISR